MVRVSRVSTDRACLYFYNIISKYLYKFLASMIKDGEYRRLRMQMHLSLCGLRREQQGCASRHLPRHRPQESQTEGLELWRFRAAPSVHLHESTRLPAHHLLGHSHHAPQSRTGTRARRHCCISMPTSQYTTEVSEVSDFVTSAALALPIPTHSALILGYQDLPDDESRGFALAEFGQLADVRVVEGDPALINHEECFILLAPGCPVGLHTRSHVLTMEFVHVSAGQQSHRLGAPAKRNIGVERAEDDESHDVDGANGNQYQWARTPSFCLRFHWQAAEHSNKLLLFNGIPLRISVVREGFLSHWGAEE